MCGTNKLYNMKTNLEGRYTSTYGFVGTNKLEKQAEMTHDKILSMTDEFVQSNRSEGQTYAHYHYDMMADFALHILETFKTK